MTALLLIAFLLVAPVAGAEDALYLNCMDLHAKTENEHLCDRFKDYAVDEDKYLISDKHIHQNCINIDGNDVCHKIKPSESEKWLKKCDSYLSEAEAFYNNLRTEESHKISINSGMAIAYCTRYNTALLEEMREKATLPKFTK